MIDGIELRMGSDPACAESIFAADENDIEFRACVARYH